MSLMKNNLIDNRLRLRIAEAEESDSRICWLEMILDISGSMSPREKVVFGAVSATLKALAAKQNEDLEYRVRLTLFSDGVKVFNEEWLPPEQLAELFTGDVCRCGGGTNLSAIVNHIDGSFSRSSKLFSKNIHTGDPMPVVVIITDFVGTDDPKSRAKAMNTLSSNRLFTRSKCLCIFCGPESSKAEAAALCGSEENLVALSDSEYASLLAPLLLTSTLSMSDGTHLGGEMTTPADYKKRSEEGKKGADELNDEELKNELDRLFNP